MKLYFVRFDLKFAWLVLLVTSLYYSSLPSTNAQRTIDPMADMPDITHHSEDSLLQALRWARRRNPSPRRYLFALWHVFRGELTIDHNHDLPEAAATIVSMMAQIDCIFIHSPEHQPKFDRNSAEDRAVLADGFVQLATEWNHRFQGMAKGPLDGFQRVIYPAQERMMLDLIRQTPDFDFTGMTLVVNQEWDFWAEGLCQTYRSYRDKTQTQRGQLLKKVNRRQREGYMSRYILTQYCVLFAVNRLLPDPARGGLKTRIEQLLPDDPRWDTWQGMRQAAGAAAGR